MPVEIIYKNRRKGGDRRQTLTPDHVPERRSGLDRRKLDEKLKQLIESDLKDQGKEKQAPAPSASGSVILRKKGEGDQKRDASDPDESKPE